MTKFNIIGAAVLGVITGLISGFYISNVRERNEWGEGMYTWVVIFAALAFTAGGFLVGLFQKENYERFKNETDDEYKRRMKRMKIMI